MSVDNFCLYWGIFVCSKSSVCERVRCMFIWKANWNKIDSYWVYSFSEK